MPVRQFATVDLPWSGRFSRFAVHVHEWRTGAYGQLAHMANWRVWRTGMWQTGSYGELTMAN